MIYPLSTTELCKLLITQWRESLVLTNLEKSQLKHELSSLDKQIDRLSNKKLRVSVFGRVGVGKSSLLNALLNKNTFITDIAHGSTRNSQSTLWNQPIEKLTSIELIDTPGIDEIDKGRRIEQTSDICCKSDLILFVIDGDLTSIELEALQSLIHNGKPICLILNRCDQWQSSEIKQLQTSIRKRLPLQSKNLPLIAISAAPRKSQVLPTGQVRSVPSSPRIQPLRVLLKNLLKEQGEFFLSLNSLYAADNFYTCLKEGRLKRGKLAAQGVIGKFAALKASGVAACPILMIDLTAGLACDTALVIELSKIYGLQLRGPAARELLKRLSLYNILLGGAQFSIQFCLSILRHILLIASPFTGGLSLVSTGPVALAQAALAVHTTKITGKLAAREFLKSSHQKCIQPSSIFARLLNNDPEIKLLLNQWPLAIPTSKKIHRNPNLLP